MKRYFYSGGAVFAESIVINLFGMIVLAFVARSLGPSDYGLYAYVFSLASIFGLLGQLGLDGILIRELVTSRQPSSVILGTTLALRLAGYTLGALLMFAAVPFLASKGEKEVLLYVSACISIVLISPTGIFSSWFRAKVESEKAMVANVIASVISGLAKIVLVYCGYGVVSIGFSQAFGAAVGVLLLFVLFGHGSGPPLKAWRVDLPYARSLLSQSWAIFLGSALALIYLNIDLTMLRIISGPAVSGEYAASVKLIQALYIIPAAFSVTLFPYLATVNSESKIQFFHAMRLGYSAIAVMSYVSIVALWLFGDYLVRGLFGADYLNSVNSLMILSLTLPFSFSRYLTTRWIVIESKGRYLILSEGAGAIINILLNLALIPEYGGAGSAFATLAAFVVSSYLSLAFSKSGRELFAIITISFFNPFSILFREIRKRLS
ncbi:flippase [Mesorhizobium delmotii]|uniref:Putative Polysaccharide biosynthesis protein n=1 Tax=Mesorhizobium delmotii TaxID=1631247 RepID=A0A2P9AF12_9HYPH|nr:flippase [Mesorhizobium delmotii]SJM29730.1 putative Polysaccharide biosynthesis protein [Mesorhizobium delmotii]